MPINLEGRANSSDVDTVRNKRNKTDYREGFGPSKSDDDEIDFESLFDDIGADEFEGSDLYGSGGKEAKFSSLDKSNGSGVQIGGTNLAYGSNAPAKGEKPELSEVFFQYNVDNIVVFAKIITQAGASISNRNADDWGYYGRNIIVTSIWMVGIGFGCFVISLILGQSGRLLLNLVKDIIAGAIISNGIGILSLSGAAIYLMGNNKNIQDGIEDLKDVKQEIFNDDVDDYEYTMEKMFDMEYDDEEGFEQGYLDDDEDEDEEEYDVEDFMGAGSSINIKFDDKKEGDNGQGLLEKLNNIDVASNVPLLSRVLLVDTFKPMFPIYTREFNKKDNIPNHDKRFDIIDTLCQKALAAAARVEVSEINTETVSIVETFFSYIIVMKRVKGLKNLDEIAKEMETYFRESSSDRGVTCVVALEGDYYKIMVNKGVAKAIITYGDLFSVREVEEFFKNTKHKFPFIAGIAENGDIVLADGKELESGIIAGKTGSGKTWYMLNLLLSLLIFNTPEEVQMLVIDPKNSNLFKTFSLLPHVCGLHDGIEILPILRDIMENEVKRRKKLLSDNRCENIWDLREKGIMLPVLYIVCDEFMTITSWFKDTPDNPELNNILKVFLTQYRFIGIRLIIISHRTVGTLSKDIRTNISFMAALKAEEEIVKETLMVKKWTKALVHAGDTALKMQGFECEMYVKGPAITDTDKNNDILIRHIAKTFYKMGVEIPDMSGLGKAYNRDMEHIKRELEADFSHSNKVRFDIDDTSDIDLEVTN